MNSKIRILIEKVVRKKLTRILLMLIRWKAQLHTKNEVAKKTRRDITSM